MKRIIWESNPHLDEHELKLVREDMQEMGIDAVLTMSDSEVMDYYTTAINADYYDCEKMNLDQILPGQVLVIADLGLWNGRRQGYRVMGNNLNDILKSHVNGASDMCIFGDGYNVRADESHHDGENHYMYRLIRSDKNPQPLLDAIYAGREISSALLNRYTKSVFPYVANIYGWPCRQKSNSKKEGVAL